MSLRTKFTFQRTSPPTSCAWIDRPVNKCLKTLPLEVFTQSNFVADFIRKNPLLYEKIATLHFSPIWEGGLETTYAVHLRLMGKSVVEVLLVIIELFLIGVTVDGLRANIDWKSLFLKLVGKFGRKFQVALGL